MGGDDDVARNGGKTAKGALAAWSERHRGVSWNLWSDRLSRKSACGLRVSRPLRAVRRRPLEVDISGWPSAGVASGHRRTAHRGLGLGQMPRAWNVGGNFLYGGRNVADSMAQGRLEFGEERTGIDKSEKQAEVSGQQRSEAGQHPDKGGVAAQSENVAVEDSL